MAEFSSILSRFDLKERVLLIRHCTGTNRNSSASCGVMPLSPDFCADVSHRLKLDTPITPSAWWSFDYDLDWLYGAIHWYAYEGLHPSWREFPQKNDDEVRGSNQDIDLVIAQGHRVILVEAKAFDSWSNNKLSKKVPRIARIAKKAELLGGYPHLAFHFGLISITPPIGIKTDNWPDWALDGDLLDGRKPFWVPLKTLHSSASMLKVERCDANEAPRKEGGYWRVFETPAIAPEKE